MGRKFKSKSGPRKNRFCAGRDSNPWRDVASRHSTTKEERCTAMEDSWVVRDVRSEGPLMQASLRLFAGFCEPSPPPFHLFTFWVDEGSSRRLCFLRCNARPFSFVAVASFKFSPKIPSFFSRVEGPRLGIHCVWEREICQSCKVFACISSWRFLENCLVWLNKVWIHRSRYY